MNTLRKCEATVQELISRTEAIVLLGYPAATIRAISCSRGLSSDSGLGRPFRSTPSGGSIPFVSSLAAAQRIDVALLGFGLPGDAIHAPNERFYLPSLARGTRACAELYSCLAGIQPRT
jgi:hypothetical protein